ncbi:hypothetical protein [Mesonia mobilis]|uniref:hypothetical protein n=1 Tax=Mesonia mobilis TaxID=369791 RepID=UPI00040F68DF|nr:hypothetical protein [Mesonia mobilis]MBQ0737844.1 hypothetical protein [Aquimarina celericrescens]
MKKFQQHITYFLLAVFTASQFYLSFHFLAIDHEYLINDFSSEESYVQELKLASLKSHECSIFHLWKNNWLILNAESNYELNDISQTKYFSFIAISHIKTVSLFYYLRGPPNEVQLS